MEVRSLVAGEPLQRLGEVPTALCIVREGCLELAVHGPAGRMVIQTLRAGDIDGDGVHKCIGLHFGTLEVKAILHEMLITYRWTVPDDYQVRWDNISLPVPVDGLPVRFQPLTVTPPARN